MNISLIPPGKNHKVSSIITTNKAKLPPLVSDKNK